MTTTLADPPTDIRTQPGGEFVADCIEAVEHEAFVILHRERRYRDKRLETDPELVRKAALLMAAMAMLEQLRADGGAMAQAGARKNYTVVNAVTAGKSAFQATAGEFRT